MFAVDGTPSVRLAGLARSTAGSDTFGGVDGWAVDAVEADGFSAEAPDAAKEGDPLAAARAEEHAAGITGVDGFEIEPAVLARPAAKEPKAAGPAAPAVPEGPERLRIEVGGPSAVAVVPMLCRLSKIKRPGAPPLRPHCESVHLVRPLNVASFVRIRQAVPVQEAAQRLLRLRRHGRGPFAWCASHAAALSTSSLLMCWTEQPSDALHARVRRHGI